MACQASTPARIPEFADLGRDGVLFVRAGQHAAVEADADREREHYVLWGAGRAGTYPLSTANQAVLVSPGATNVYFNGRLLGAPDRLGSTVATYPYGGRVHDH